MKQWLAKAWFKWVGGVALLLPCAAHAQPPVVDDPMRTPGLGEVFGNLFYLVLNIRGLVRTVMLVTAVGLVMSAFIRYQKYKQNPVETPLSSVFLILLVAVVLVVLALIPIQAGDAEST